jgi:MOSC domain-containing protein YiiM
MSSGMKLVSVNVGRPREVEWRGKLVRTSIFKAPVSGRVRVERLNLQGDQQSDLSVHGGRDKSVYAYPSEHYAFWRIELPDAPLDPGAFGENFTIEGLLEDRVCIGDQLRCGTAAFVVTQPRTPCFKLGIRFGRPDIVKRFQRSGRSGFYLAVLREGEIAAGDPLELIESPGERMSVAEIARLAGDDTADPELLRRVSELPALAESWRKHFRARLGQGPTRESADPQRGRAERSGER